MFSWLLCSCYVFLYYIFLFCWGERQCYVVLAFSYLLGSVTPLPMVDASMTNGILRVKPARKFRKFTLNSMDFLALWVSAGPKSWREPVHCCTRISKIGDQFPWWSGMFTRRQSPRPRWGRDRDETETEMRPRDLQKPSRDRDFLTDIIILGLHSWYSVLTCWWSFRIYCVTAQNKWGYITLYCLIESLLSVDSF